MTANLLVVDDEEQICRMLERHFRILGYRVDMASDGQQALQRLSQERYEVVISDIIMPGMLGTELLAYIRRDYPMTRVIMITGYVTFEHALDCFRRGAETCIFKPFTDLGELEQAVAGAIAHLQHWQEKLRQLRGLTED